MKGHVFITMLLIVGCLFGCAPITPVVTTDNFGTDVAYASVTLAMVKTSPTPAPVIPSGKCDNCNGLGWIGDGRSWVACPVCNPDEKKPRPNSKGGDPSILTPDIQAELKQLPQAIAEALSPSFDRMIDRLQPKAETLPPKVNPAPVIAPPVAPVTQAKPSHPQRAPPATQMNFVDDNGVHWTHPDSITNHLLSSNHNVKWGQLSGRSNEQLKTIHDWLHEGKITAAAIPYLNMSATAPVKSAQSRAPATSTLGPVKKCPDGVTCPVNGTQSLYQSWPQSSRRRIFGW